MLGLESKEALLVLEF